MKIFLEFGKLRFKATFTDHVLIITVKVPTSLVGH